MTPLFLGHHGGAVVFLQIKPLGTNQYTSTCTDPAIIWKETFTLSDTFGTKSGWTKVRQAVTLQIRLFALYTINRTNFISA